MRAHWDDIARRIRLGGLSPAAAVEELQKVPSINMADVGQVGEAMAQRLGLSFGELLAAMRGAKALGAGLRTIGRATDPASP